MTKPSLDRPFMPARDGAGSFELDNPDDGTPIREMFTFRDRLVLITEKCTYEMQTADQVDPARANPGLPHNFQSKLFDHGIHSQALRKILLQGKALFQKDHLPIDLGAAQSLTIDALKEFAAMDEAATAFGKLESAAIERLEKANPQARSFSIPTIGGVDTFCKTFAQKAHHFDKALLSIARLFIPTATNWDKLSEIVHIRYGKEDPFSKLIAQITPHLKLVLHLRDALEHQNNKAVTVRDFTVDANGDLAPPSIELDFRKSVLSQVSVSSLMNGLTEALPIYFEMTIVHLCSKFTQPLGGFPMVVELLPESFQKSHLVRYGYCARMPNGQLMPFTG